MAMRRKYVARDFGGCPRSLCFGQAVLPLGLEDVLGGDCVKVFCPRCEEVYDVAVHGQPGLRGPSNGAANKKEAELLAAHDGAHWGTSFPHLFIEAFPETRPPRDGTYGRYIPRIHGFRLISLDTER